MSATLELKRWIASGTTDAFYNNYIQFTTIDSANVSSGNYPVGRPSGGANYSSEVYLFLEVTNPPNNSISNIRFWGNPDIPDTGIMMYVGTAVATSTPINSLSSISINNSTAYYDSDNSLLWSDKVLENSQDYSYYLVMQLRIYSSAIAGDHYGDNCVFHYSYDES